MEIGAILRGEIGPSARLMRDLDDEMYVAARQEKVEYKHQQQVRIRHWVVEHNR